MKKIWSRVGFPVLCVGVLALGTSGAFAAAPLERVAGEGQSGFSDAGVRMQKILKNPTRWRPPELSGGPVAVVANKQPSPSAERSCTGNYAKEIESLSSDIFALENPPSLLASEWLLNILAFPWDAADYIQDQNRLSQVRRRKKQLTRARNLIKQAEWGVEHLNSKITTVQNLLGEEFRQIYQKVREGNPSIPARTVAEKIHFGDQTELFCIEKNAAFGQIQAWVLGELLPGFASSQIAGPTPPRSGKPLEEDLCARMPQAC